LETISCRQRVMSNSYGRAKQCTLQCRNLHHSYKATDQSEHGILAQYLQHSTLGS
jgi:hypothetical protein